MKQLAGKLCDIKSTICEQECVSLFFTAWENQVGEALYQKTGTGELLT